MWVLGKPRRNQSARRNYTHGKTRRGVDDLDLTWSRIDLSELAMLLSQLEELAIDMKDAMHHL